MKTKLKRYTKLIALCFASLLLSNCEGDTGADGLTGENGKQGEIGPQGPQGETGQPGNANVKQYNFDAFTHAGSEIRREIQLTSAEYETSMIYVFVSTNNFWYLLPGYVTPLHSYRIYFRSNTNNVECFMDRLTGTGTQNFTAMRIFIIQSSSVVNAKNKNNDKNVKTAKTDDGNFYTDDELKQMSYEQFCKALNISTN